MHTGQSILVQTNLTSRSTIVVLSTTIIAVNGVILGIIAVPTVVLSIGSMTVRARTTGSSRANRASSQQVHFLKHQHFSIIAPRAQTVNRCFYTTSSSPSVPASRARATRTRSNQPTNQIMLPPCGYNRRAGSVGTQGTHRRQRFQMHGATAESLLHDQHHRRHASQRSCARR